MSTLEEIKKPIADEMAAFETKFRSSMASRVPLLDKITHYIVKRKGKQMRPMLVFLSARLVGQPTDATYLGASLIELMHTATLVHDDVVDDANQRRGFFSLNALWKNKIAVLVGDYLLSKVLLLSVEHKEYRLLEIVSEAVKQMSEGELLQIEKARRLDITEEVYYEIIRQKTASLIATCCAAGVHSAGGDEESIEKIRQFGEHLGMAFQIKDDLFDYQANNKSGKPTGIDIKEQKMTLPLIYTLIHATSGEKKKIINIVKNHYDNTQKVAEVVEMVKLSGGLDYAQEIMNQYRAKAEEILQTFPDNEARKSLFSLVDFVIQRTK